MYPPDWQYCPRCRTELEAADISGAIRPRCPACDFIYYADPKVAAGVLVERDGKILLGKRRWNPGMGLWYLPSGFVDYGESISSAAVREVHEETGLTVEAIELLGIWDYDLDESGKKGNLVFYRGRIAGGTPAPADDVVELGWFAPDSLPQIAFPAHRRIIASLNRSDENAFDGEQEARGPA